MLCVARACGTKVVVPFLLPLPYHPFPKRPFGKKLWFGGHVRDHHGN